MVRSRRQNAKFIGLGLDGWWTTLSVLLYRASAAFTLHVASRSCFPAVLDNKSVLFEIRSCLLSWRNLTDNLLSSTTEIIKIITVVIVSVHARISRKPPLNKSLVFAAVARTRDDRREKVHASSCKADHLFHIQIVGCRTLYDMNWLIASDYSSTSYLKFCCSQERDKRF